MLSNGLFLNLEKVAGRWTDYLVTINQEDYSTAKKHKIVSHERLKYMPGIGVDLKIYSPGKITPASITHLREKLGVNASDWLFLVVGELNRNKRPDLILDALATMQRKNVHLVYVGSGYLEASLRIQSERLNLREQTHFLGSRSDVPALLEAADALILASQREGLPRSIMEAMCMERPCIGSDVRGTRDLLANDCGVIFKTDDQADLTRAMTWLIDHPTEARSMAALGCRQMERYDIRKILKQHEDLYDEALAAS